MTDWLQATAASGSLALAAPVAVLAGLVSFFSPCVLPLLPGYFSYATGLSGADIAEGRGSRRRMVAGSVLFVAGFGAVFVTLGALAGSVSTWLRVNQSTLSFWLGLFTIVLGLAFIGLVPWLQRDLRVHKVPAVGLGAAPVLGFLFGLGWTPCIGPTLGVILGLGYSEGTAGRSALLLAFYTLGLGVPFVLAGLMWRHALGTFAWVRRHQVWVTRSGGLMMVLVGVLLVTGWWDYAVTWLQGNLVSEFEVAI